MKLDELKKKEPALYAEVLALGAAEERQRTEKCLALMKRPALAEHGGITSMILEGLSGRRPYAEIVDAAASMLTAALESPGDLATGGVDSATGELPEGGRPGWKPGHAAEV